MDVVLALTSLLFVACCVAQPAKDAAWEMYKTKFGKTYTEDEEPVRYARWKQTVSEVHLHNSEYAASAGFKQGINQFADMSAEEFKTTMLTLKVPKDRKKGNVYSFFVELISIRH